MTGGFEQLHGGNSATAEMGSLWGTRFGAGGGEPRPLSARCFSDVQEETRHVGGECRRPGLGREGRAEAET